jgi:PAS domain S-box-containing protein
VEDAGLPLRGGRPPEPGAMVDIVGDRQGLVIIGMVAVWVACAAFAVLRLAVTVHSGAPTPWWANAFGAAALPLLYLWYRRRPETRSAVAVHCTALIATIALLVAVWYGMTSSIWWLGLVGFAMVLLGRPFEASLWGIGIPVVVVATIVLEPWVRVGGAAAEPPLERALAKIAFVALVIGMAAGFRRVAERRALALHDSEERYRTLLQRAPVGVFHYDRDLRITDCNEAFERIFGGRRESLVVSDPGSSGDRGMLAALRAPIAGRHGEYNGRVGPFSGSGEVIVAVRTVPLHAKGGSITGAIGIVEDITHRERMEEELRRSHDELEARVRERTQDLARLNLNLEESEKRFRTLVESLGEGVALVDPNETLVYCNPAADRIFGASTGDLVGRNLAEFSTPDEFGRFQRETELRAQGVSATYEAPIRRADGEIRNLLVTLTPRFDSAGAYTGALSIFMDITDRTRAEEALREREALYRAATGASADGFWMADLEGRLLDVNDAYVRRSGYSREELLSMRISDVEAQENPSVTAAHVRNIIEHGSDRFETLHRAKDGAIWPADITATYWPIKGGRLFVFIRDITERKRAEEARRESEARFRSYIASAPLAVLVADKGGRLIDFNPAALEMLGYDRMSLAGTHFTSLLAFRDLKAVRRDLTLLTTTGHAEREYKLKRRDGSRIWVSFHAAMLPSGDALAYCQDITDRIEAEEALRRSERDLAEAQRLAKLGSWRLDLATGEATWSDELYGIFAVERDSVRPTFAAFLEHVHPEDRAMLLTDNERVRMGAEPTPVEFRILTPSGQTKEIRGAAYPVRDEAGVTTGLIGTAQDITERKQGEVALRRANDRIKSVLASMTDAYNLFDRDWRFVDVNQAAVDGMGLSREQVVGRTLWELYPDIVGTDLERGFRQAMARRAASSFEFYYPKSYRWWHNRFYPVSEGLAVFGTDITARKRAEEALRASEAQLSNALAVARMGHWEYDVPRDTFTFNHNFYAMLRTTAEREGGYTMSSSRYVQRFVHPDDAAVVAGEIRQAIETTDPSFSGALEHRVVFGDGKVGHVAVRFSIVKDATGRTVKTYGANQDVTEQKHAEDALRQVQKMDAVGTLAGGIAHDFNNVLQALLSQAQLLRGRCTHPLEVEALARDLERQVGRGAALTRQLLLFSRQETARMERVDLNEIVRDAIKMLRRLVRANIALETDLATERLFVKADRGQLDQVLLNLVVNASDAMPEGGTLTIRTGADGRARSWLAVTDTGQGIPEEVRERIFEPFFTTKAAGKGTGLGLSVVHGIVAKHGGEIEVESTPGKGTTFRVLLPAAEGEEGFPSPGRGKGAHQPGRGHGERILVVEDEPGAREALRDILGTLGYEVVAAASGEEAGRMAAEPRFDVLLTDLMLPGVAGSDLAVGLRERWPGLRVIFMSGYTEDEELLDGVQAGVIHFLQKPFDIDVLARELRQVLDESPPRAM